MYLSNNTKSVNLSILLPVFIIFYFNSCMSGFIKGSSYLSFIVVGIWIVSFVSTTDVYVQNKFFFLSKPLMFCIAWLAILLLLGRDEEIEAHLKMSLYNCIYLAMTTYVLVKYSHPGGEAERKFIFNFWLIDTVLSCIYTIYRLEENHELSRFLSTGEYARDRYLTGIDTRGVVSFSVVYGLLFILPFLIQRFSNLNNNNKGKLTAAIISLIFLFTIIEAQFSIAIILAVGLVFYSLMLKNSKNSLNVLIFVFLSVCILFFAPYIIEWVLSMDILKDTAESRMQEILALLNGENIGGTDLNSRFNLYSDSIKAIFESMFFGRVIIKTTSEVGGHSELLDSLANFGLIYVVFLISFFVRIYKDVKEKIPDNYKTTYFVVQIVMLFISIVNTSMWMPMTMILTMIVPFYIMDNNINSEEISRDGDI